MKIKRLDWYWAFLQQDWCIFQVVDINDETITVNYHGFLWNYGVPVFEQDIPVDWFETAYKRSPDNDWSRKYHENTFDGVYYSNKRMDEMG